MGFNAFVFEVLKYLSLHTPLTSETEHMINRDAMRLMKPSAIIINAARGPIWDE